MRKIFVSRLSLRFESRRARQTESVDTNAFRFLLSIRKAALVAAWGRFIAMDNHGPPVINAAG